jgi:NADH-quinone oxidoreductase subunit C
MVTHILTRTARVDALAAAIRAHFAESDFELIDAFDELTLDVPAERLLDVARTLRDHDDFRFEQLIDLCGVDYAAYGRSEWETDEASSDGLRARCRSRPSDRGR